MGCEPPIITPGLIATPPACQVPTSVSPALGLLLTTCCSSFTKRGSGQFYTSFDLCSRICSSFRGSLPLRRQCLSPILAFQWSHRASPWASLGYALGPEQTMPVTWPFLLGFLSGNWDRTSVSEASTGGLSNDQENPRAGKNPSDWSPTVPSYRWGNWGIESILWVLKTLLKVCHQFMAGSCLPSLRGESPGQLLSQAS